MSLLTDEEARPWAKSTRQKVLAREMPPWYIDKNIGVRHFKERRIAVRRGNCVVNQVDGGAPKGNPADMPPPPKFEDSGQGYFRSGHQCGCTDNQSR
jgi:hypothetical protein